MNKYRLRFEKTGLAKYISHLDLMRLFQRAFLRAGLPLQYSGGYNPHAMISILLPLPLGMESVCELMDFRLSGEAEPERIVDALNAALPEGVRGHMAYSPERKETDVKWMEVEGVLEYDSRPISEMAKRLAGFFACESIVVTKKTKRGEGEIDIVPHIREIGFAEGEDGVTLRAVISAREPTLRPGDLLNAIGAFAPELTPDFCRFKRTELFDGDMRVFA